MANKSQALKNENNRSRLHRKFRILVGPAQVTQISLYHFYRKARNGCLERVEVETNHYRSEDITEFDPVSIISFLLVGIPIMMINYHLKSYSRTPTLPGVKGINLSIPKASADN